MPARRHGSHPLLVLLAIATALLCSACKTHLVGLRDVVLRFQVAEGQPPVDDLDTRIALRLAAAEVAADIDVPAPQKVDVRVDDDLASDTVKLLLWRGGLRVTADEQPALEIDTTAAIADGPRVLVPLTSAAEATLEALATRVPAPHVAIVRDHTLLATGAATGGVAPQEPGVRPAPVYAIVDHRLVLPFGGPGAIVAYTEAADVAHLLATPKLPLLIQLSSHPLPKDWPLAAANLILPFAVSFAWLFFVRRFDRAQPEPMWLVVATFALGALAVVPAGLVEWGWDTLSPYTNPTFLTFGRSPRAFPVALLGFIVTVGVSEEGAKLLATWSLATHRKEFDEPVDGMVYGAAAALGFAAAENIRYLAIGRVAGALVASRAFMSVPAHLFFGTIWGFALGRRLVNPKARVWPLFLLAVSLHGLFDTLLSIDGGGLWAIPVGLLVASIFIVHLRIALRHGAISDAGAVSPDARGPQELFRMGSVGVFAGFAFAMYFFSATIFFLTLLDHSGRVGIAFIVASTIALALLGWAARGVAASLPLDVVVDDAAVTFAGATILYRDVLRIERRRVTGSPRRQEQMIIIADARRLILGPASRDTIDALAHALAMRLSSVALRSS